MIKIDYKGIVESLRRQFDQVVVEARRLATSPEHTDKDIALYNDIKNVIVRVDDEQAFLKIQEYDPDAIYIAVRFKEGSTNFGASAFSIVLLVHGTANKVKVAQEFLSFYSSFWTLKTLEQDLPGQDNNITQVWYTPEVIVNFAESYIDFVNLFSLRGVLVLGDNTVRLGEIYYFYKDENGVLKPESMPILAYSDSFQNALAPQAFGDTHGFTKSETSYSSFGFSVSTYLLNNHLIRDVMALRGWRQRNLNETGPESCSTKEPNDEFKIALVFSNGFSNFSSGVSESDKEHYVPEFFSKFKLSASSIRQPIGDLARIDMSFTE